MFKKIFKNADLCWIISLCISCSMVCILPLSLSICINNISIIICFTLILLIQLIAIILGCHASIISSNSTQYNTSIIFTIFSNIILIFLLFWGSFMIK